MSMYKALIVEDEKKSREVLKGLLEHYCPEVTVAGMAETVPKGVEMILAEKPDIVFLDIEMQSATGFDLLQQLEAFDFEVIFTTAYERYALKAIKFNALDYLLKPIDIGELQQAVKKAVEKRSRQPQNKNLESLFQYIRQNRSQRIAISTSEGIIYLETDQIIRCEAQGAYTQFFLKDRSKILASKNLKEFESLLKDHHFFRVHNSHLININEVLKYVKTEGGYIEMKDGSKVAISQNRKDEFMELMRQ